MTTAETQTWRVVCEGGEVLEVIVEDRGYVSDGRRQSVAGGVYIISESPRVAVVRWCAMEAHEKAVVELVAPGAQTSEERLAQVTAERDAARAKTDALRVALADADLIMEQRERQITASLTTAAEERARCAAVCREVMSRYRHGACGCEECEGWFYGARACAEAIERGPVTP